MFHVEPRPHGRVLDGLGRQCRSDHASGFPLGVHRTPCSSLVPLGAFVHIDRLGLLARSPRFGPLHGCLADAPFVSFRERCSPSASIDTSREHLLACTLPRQRSAGSPQRNTDSETVRFCGTPLQQATGRRSDARRGGQRQPAEGPEPCGCPKRMCAHGSAQPSTGFVTSGSVVHSRVDDATKVLDLDRVGCGDAFTCHFNWRRQPPKPGGLTVLSTVSPGRLWMRRRPRLSRRREHCRAPGAVSAREVREGRQGPAESAEAATSWRRRSFP